MKSVKSSEQAVKQSLSMNLQESQSQLNRNETEFLKVALDRYTSSIRKINDKLESKT